MDLFVIGDADTVLGFAYAGVTGATVETADEARGVLNQVVKAGQAKIVIITEPAANLIREEVDAVRFEAAMPVVVEIPGPEGPAPERRTLLELIREAVGIRV